ncbi:hypothetical protein B0T26DRAFT_755976 [Lasiosphaeria miniovina]|uniref:Uncharacterized protein n=1 Tax=Lasiosphaeria miniovina TaxID=1954250 RepID=A0AA39ZZH3_9PEZI|nr:uncharacterized protein B0T26DRAFT_755976 [Lasiosphaeria miniovina]KAK0706482.1 hypothetical protein B0T26DRAFT_755976 [Lasiosphaeria miniovina]
MAHSAICPCSTCFQATPQTYYLQQPATLQLSPKSRKGFRAAAGDSSVQSRLRRIDSMASDLIPPFSEEESDKMAPREPRWLRAPRQVTLRDYFPPEFRNDLTPAAATSRAEEPAAEHGPGEKVGAGSEPATEENVGAATEPGPEDVNDTDELQITFNQIFANGIRLKLTSSPFFPNTAADFAKL